MVKKAVKKTAKDLKLADTNRAVNTIQEDADERMDLMSRLRILPYPNLAAQAQFPFVKLQPPRLEQIFLSIAIGPNTGDIHALACVGICPLKGTEERGVEILQAFAMDDSAYVALCEAIRAILRPFGYHSFEGDVNMLSQTEPHYPVSHKPFFGGGANMQPMASERKM